MAFSQNGPRAVCIMSANGAISNVTLRQPATSGGTVTYEVCEIANNFSLSFPLTEVKLQFLRHANYNWKCYKHLNIFGVCNCIGIDMTIKRYS